MPNHPAKELSNAKCRYRVLLPLCAVITIIRHVRSNGRVCQKLSVLILIQLHALRFVFFELVCDNFRSSIRTCSWSFALLPLLLLDKMERPANLQGVSFAFPMQGRSS